MEMTKMQLQNGGGDRLASGATRAQFRPMGEKISQERWDAMWEGYDPEASKDKPAEGGSGIKETITTGVSR